MNNNQQQRNMQQMGSGLTRYRSAPSSYLAGLVAGPTGDGSFEAGDFGQIFNPRQEGERVFSRFMSSAADLPPPPQPPPTQSPVSPQVVSSAANEYPLQSFRESQENSYEKYWANTVEQMKIESSGGGGGGSSGLIRHSSSPAELLADVTAFGNPISGSSSSRFSWEDSNPMMLPDDFLAGFVVDDTPKHDQRNVRVLSHHLSLPKNALDKLLQDSVPCKIRARRGCATHPRSVAERVRRTKISERMRKLQELVPNMEKQTNTSDMLELAVSYIKDLQRQAKTLAEDRAKCSCSAKNNAS